MVFVSKTVQEFLLKKEAHYIFGSILSISIAVIVYIFSVFVMKMIKLEEVFENVEKSGLARFEKLKNPKNKEKNEKKPITFKEGDKIKELFDSKGRWRFI